MAGEVAEISFRANIAQLRQEMAKLPGVTAGEAQKMVIALERQMQKAEKAAKEAAKATAAASREASREAERAAREAEKAAGEALGKVDKATDKLTGGALGDLQDLADGFAGIRSGGLAAAGPVLALGGALVGLSAGQAVLRTEAALIAGVATGLVDATLSAQEFVKETEKFADIPDLTLGLDQEQLDSLDSAAAAVEALQVLAAKASAQIGTGFAPTLQALATVAVAAGLAFNDLLGSVGRGLTAFAKWREELEPWQRQLLDSAAPIAGLVAGADALNDRLASGQTMLGDYGKRASELVGQLVVLNREEERSADAAKAAAEAQREAAAALQEYSQRIAGREALIALQLQAVSDLTTAEDRLGDAYLEAQEKAAQAGQTAADALLLQQTLTEQEFRYQRDLNHLREEGLADERAGLAANAAAAEEAGRRRVQQAQDLQEFLKKQRAAETRETLDALATAAAGVESLAAQYASLHQSKLDKIKAERKAERDRLGYLTEAQRAAYKARGDIEREAILRGFRAEQTAALGQAAINTAVAVTQALAQLGPIAGAIATAGIVATGAAQAAAIAAQKPPTFHRGGVVHADLLDGEHLVRQGPAERYRPQLDELNRTGEWPGGGGRASTQVFLDGRLAGEIVDAGWTHSRSAGRTRPGVRKPGLGTGYDRER